MGMGMITLHTVPCVTAVRRLPASARLPRGLGLGASRIALRGELRAPSPIAAAASSSPSGVRSTCAASSVVGRRGGLAAKASSSGDAVGEGAEGKALAVFVSGGGSNLKRLHEATQDGRIAGHVAVRPHRLSMCRRTASHATLPPHRL
jgi:hypothetical protein